MLQASRDGLWLRHSLVRIQLPQPFWNNSNFFVIRRMFGLFLYLDDFGGRKGKTWRDRALGERSLFRRTSSSLRIIFYDRRPQKLQKLHEMKRGGAHVDSAFCRCSGFMTFGATSSRQDLFYRRMASPFALYLASVALFLRVYEACEYDCRIG